MLKNIYVTILKTSVIFMTLDPFTVISCLQCVTPNVNWLFVTTFPSDLQNTEKKKQQLYKEKFLLFIMVYDDVCK